MKKSIRIIDACLILVIIASFSGCSHKDRWNKVVISGDVSYQGQPIELGRIRFIPTGNTRGPVSVEKVAGGHYTTESTRGIPVGTVRVEITSYDPEEYKNTPTGPGAPPVRQRLPDKYNRQSELTLILKLEPRTQTHDFSLE